MILEPTLDGSGFLVWGPCGLHFGKPTEWNIDYIVIDVYIISVIMEYLAYVSLWYRLGRYVVRLGNVEVLLFG